uniref:Peptidyl-tRNA hydrolase n=1 Tax=Biomphalaria glabrata TaxID=6526 RepID=A0A2C9L277_BIOGL
MKLIVGLGNPGAQYENNRHNIGFKVIDAFASKHNLSLNKEKFNGIFYKGDDFIIAKPLTFMNLSGDFVQAISSFFKINIQDILVIYDDMDHEVGKAVMKPKGSSGGQNGIKDIIAKLGTDSVQRMKVGIGRPTNGKIAADHVLANFSKEEVEKLNLVKDKLVK